MPVPILNISRINRHCSSANVVFGDVTYRPGGVCGPRTQVDYQLVVIEQGEAQVEIDSATLHVPAQHVALMLPGRREHFHFARDAITHHSWCAVRVDAVPDPLAQRLASAPPVQVLSARMHGLIDFGLSLPASANHIAGDLIEHLGLSVLHEYLFETEASHHEKAQPESLRMARQYIDLHLDEPLDLNKIASVAYVTPQYLIRLFHRYVGTTPSRYVWQTRLSRGVEQLRETGLSITEIAERTGFKNPFHFSRMVRKQYGIPPKQLRQRVWNT